MSNIQIAHEAPLSIFDRVQSITDYDYALVNLIEDNEEYLDRFVKSIDEGREVILDNAVFELEKAFDADKFVKWVEDLRPTWYIVPDSLDNCDETISMFDNFTREYKNLPSKCIGVAQGSSYEELVECYKYLSNNSNIDMIAMSFNHPFFQEQGFDNQYLNMMYGRRDMISRMVADSIINLNIPHHLLGCGLPQEFTVYRDYKWIKSLDTSNPVIHGMKGIRYTDTGLSDKESVKLFTLINEDVSDMWTDIEYNILKFRELVNG